MLTNIEALDVVVGCVHAISGQVASPSRTLKDGGITESGRLAGFKSLVVTDSGRGVKKHDHSIASSSLSGISVEDTVQGTADIVRANAVPIAAGVLVEDAGEVTFEAPAPAPTRTARKRAARARKRKTARKKAATKKAATRRAATKKAGGKEAGRKKATKKAGRKTRAAKRGGGKATRASRSTRRKGRKQASTSARRASKRRVR